MPDGLMPYEQSVTLPFPLDPSARGVTRVGPMRAVGERSTR
jgi:hypothetical protein